MVQCTKAEASKRTNLERYRPITHLQGAGAGAWLWNSLTAAANGKNALERLERAHCSSLPFGVPYDGCRFADAIFHKIKSRLDRKAPILVLGDPSAEPVGHVPTVSFSANYVGGSAKELSTWCVGVASTAIEEALQLAVASLYLFDWKKQEKDVSGFANYAQITALLSTFFRG